MNLHDTLKMISPMFGLCLFEIELCVLSSLSHSMHTFMTREIDLLRQREIRKQMSERSALRTKLMSLREIRARSTPKEQFVMNDELSGLFRSFHMRGHIMSPLTEIEYRTSMVNLELLVDSGAQMTDRHIFCERFEETMNAIEHIEEKWNWYDPVSHMRLSFPSDQFLQSFTIWLRLIRLIFLSNPSMAYRSMPLTWESNLNPVQRCIHFMRILKTHHRTYIALKNVATFEKDLENTVIRNPDFLNLLREVEKFTHWMLNLLQVCAEIAEVEHKEEEEKKKKEQEAAAATEAIAAKEEEKVVQNEVQEAGIMDAPAAADGGGLLEGEQDLGDGHEIQEELPQVDDMEEQEAPLRATSIRLPEYLLRQYEYTLFDACTYPIASNVKHDQYDRYTQCMNEIWLKRRGGKGENERLEWRQMRWNLIRRYCNIGTSAAAASSPPPLPRPYLISDESKDTVWHNLNIWLPSISHEMTRMIMLHCSTYHTLMRSAISHLSTRVVEDPRTERTVRDSVKKWLAPYFTSKNGRRRLRQLFRDGTITVLIRRTSGMPEDDQSRDRSSWYSFVQVDSTSVSHRFVSALYFEFLRRGEMKLIRLIVKYIHPATPSSCNFVDPWNSLSPIKFVSGRGHRYARMRRRAIGALETEEKEDSPPVAPLVGIEPNPGPTTDSPFESVSSSHLTKMSMFDTLRTISPMFGLCLMEIELRVFASVSRAMNTFITHEIDCFESRRMRQETIERDALHTRIVELRTTRASLTSEHQFELDSKLRLLYAELVCPWSREFLPFDFTSTVESSPPIDLNTPRTSYTHTTLVRFNSLISSGARFSKPEGIAKSFMCSMNILANISIKWSHMQHYKHLFLPSFVSYLRILRSLLLLSPSSALDLTFDELDIPSRCFAFLRAFKCRLKVKEKSMNAQKVKSDLQTVLIKTKYSGGSNGNKWNGEELMFVLRELTAFTEWLHLLFQVYTRIEPEKYSPDFISSRMFTSCQNGTLGKNLSNLNYDEYMQLVDAVWEERAQQQQRKGRHGDTSVFTDSTHDRLEWRQLRWNVIRRYCNISIRSQQTPSSSNCVRSGCSIVILSNTSSMSNAAVDSNANQLSTIELANLTRTLTYDNPTFCGIC